MLTIIMLPYADDDRAEDDCPDPDAPTGLARAVNTVAGHAIGLVWILALGLLGLVFGAAASMRRPGQASSTNL